MLAEAIDVWIRREIGLYAQVLRLKDQRVWRGGEEDLFCGRTNDAERERAGCVVELDLRLCRGQARTGGWTREDGVGDLISSCQRIGYFEMDTRFCKALFFGL